MTNYKLEVIPGTENYVEQELLAKFPEASIVHKESNSVEFTSQIAEVDEFRILYSALRITKQDGPTRNLFRREWRKEYVPAGINPALAYVLCMAAQLTPADIALDPFCGGGTIPITASLYFNVSKTIASDLSGKAVDVTLKNFQAAGISSKRYAVFRSNVSQLKIQPSYITKVITNLPFGVRVGDHETNKLVYKSFADKCQRMVKIEGLIVILTQEKQLLAEAFALSNFRLEHSFDISQGGLIPRVFVYRKVNG